jgi:hypothetical protein
METKESKRGQKLYYYLSRLSPKELKDFHAYLSSPLLGNSAQMARMLLTIEAEVLARGGRVIDADIFQAEFFPDQALDEGKRKYIRIRLVQLLDRLLDFAAFMEYKSDTNAQHLSLLKTMYTRGWEKYFERTYQEIEAMPPKKDFGEYHLYRMRREIVRNEFFTAKASSAQETNLEETAKRIDACMILFTLKNACAILVNQIHWNMKIDTRFTAQVLEYAKQEPFSNSLEITAYAETYQMLKAHAESQALAREHFLKIKLILKEPTELDKSESRDLFGMAHNFCTWSIQQNKLEFVQEIQELYQDALSSNILTSEGMIVKKLYFTIVSQMCKYGEITWSSKFVEDWKDKIVEDTDRSTYFVTRSLVHLQLGEYDKAIEILHPRIGLINDEIIGINARIYFCQALWNKREFQWLSFQLEAFRQFILRAMQNNKSQKIRYLRFLEIFNKMCQAQLGKPDLILLKLKKIKDSVESNNETSKYFWLYKILATSVENFGRKN